MRKSKGELELVSFRGPKGKIPPNEKAISPIFATLVILAVVTVLFIPVFIWATGTSSQTQDSWLASGRDVTERIVIEEVSLKAGSEDCTIYVRNIGKTAVTVENVFIYLADRTGTMHVYSPPAVITSENSVIQGDLITVTIDLGFAPASNEVYTLEVFTTRGIGDTYQVVT